MDSMAFRATMLWNVEVPLGSALYLNTGRHILHQEQEYSSEKALLPLLDFQIWYNLRVSCIRIDSGYM